MTTPTTTRSRVFAKGPKRSAKRALSLTKALPNIALGKGLSTMQLSAMISLPRATTLALGKGFAKSRTALSKCHRHDVPNHYTIPQVLYSLCRELHVWRLAKQLPRAGGLLTKCIAVTISKIFAERGASELLAKSFQFFLKKYTLPSDPP